VEVGTARAAALACVLGTGSSGRWGRGGGGGGGGPLNPGICGTCDLGCAEVETDVVSAAPIGSGTGDDGGKGTKFSCGSRSLLPKQLKGKPESCLDLLLPLALAGLSAFPGVRCSLLLMVLGVGSNFPEIQGLVSLTLPKRLYHNCLTP
jgi:hypothetical protein